MTFVFTLLILGLQKTKVFSVLIEGPKRSHDAPIYGEVFSPILPPVGILGAPEGNKSAVCNLQESSIGMRRFQSIQTPERNQALPADMTKMMMITATARTNNLEGIIYLLLKRLIIFVLLATRHPMIR